MDKAKFSKSAKLGGFESDPEYSPGHVLTHLTPAHAICYSFVLSYFLDRYSGKCIFTRYVAG
jgi:hypothetical protein